MKENERLADSQESAVAVPVVADPVQVEVAFGVVPVEVGDMQVAIEVAPDRATTYMQDSF